MIMTGNEYTVDTSGLVTRWMLDRAVVVLRTHNACAKKLRTVLDWKELETKQAMLRSNLDLCL